MLVRRKDERAPERSVARFGRAMRALTRRQSLHEVALAPRGVDGAASDDADWVTPRSAPVDAAVFVAGNPRSADIPSAARRPVPLVLITYAATEGNIRAALDAIGGDGLLAESPQLIRIERE